FGSKSQVLGPPAGGFGARARFHVTVPPPPRPPPPPPPPPALAPAAGTVPERSPESAASWNRPLKDPTTDLSAPRIENSTRSSVTVPSRAELFHLPVSFGPSARSITLAYWGSRGLFVDCASQSPVRSAAGGVAAITNNASAVMYMMSS